MGIPKGLDFAGGLEITLVLDDRQVLTGRFLGEIEGRKTDGGPEWPDGDKCEKPDDKCKKPDDKCCKMPKLDIDVEVEDDREFLLLQLTADATVVTLAGVTLVTVGTAITGVTLGVETTTFPSGSIVAVNVDEILYAGTGTSVYTSGTIGF